MSWLAILIVALFAVMIAMLLLDHKLFTPITNYEKELLGDYPLGTSLYDRFVLPPLRWAAKKYLVVVAVLLAIYIVGMILEIADMAVGIL